MKNNLSKLLPCIVILMIFTFASYHNLKQFYDQILEYSGFFDEDDFEDLLRQENDRAQEDQLKYENLLDPSNTQEDPVEENNQNHEDLRLHALSALLMDAKNNRVLYEENGYKEMHMASTTKIMTCLVTLENGNLQDIVTISPYAARMPDVQLNVRSGEQYYLKDLLYSLMLTSHNDVAVAIAEHVGGSVEGFATMMNNKAKELGCSHTNFVTPNGLDAPGHKTTAYDLARIASYAIKNEQFIAITNTSTHSFREINNKRSFTVSNKNRFLYMMEGAIGIKTGFTNGAGYCFVGAIKQSDRTLISVVLGSGWPPNKNYKWTDTKMLMNYGIKNFKNKQIFEKIKLDPILVQNGQQKYQNLTMEGNLELLLGEKEKVTIDYEIPQIIQAPVNKDEIVGYARYYIDEMLYAEIPIYTTTSIDKIDFNFCFKKILLGWLGGE